MFNSFLGWVDLNRRSLFRFTLNGESEERDLSVSTLKVMQPPYLPQKESVITDISGQRVSNLSSSKCYRDFDLSWKELGDDADDFAYILKKLFDTQLGGGTITFCPVFPWDEEKATVVLWNLKEETVGLLYDDQAKMMPADLELRSVGLFDYGAAMSGGGGDGGGPVDPPDPLNPDDPNSPIAPLIPLNLEGAWGLDGELHLWWARSAGAEGYILKYGNTPDSVYPNTVELLVSELVTPLNPFYIVPNADPLLDYYAVLTAWKEV